MVDGLDELKLKSFDLVGIYAQSGREDLVRYAERILMCCPELHLRTVSERNTGNTVAFSVDHVRWCRVRLCPCCCWAKSGKLRARLFKVVPRIVDLYGYKFLLVTLTCKNCHQDNSRETIDLLNNGWRTFTNRRTFPAIGYFKSLEVTMPYDIYYRGKFIKRMGEKVYQQWLYDNKNQLDFNQIDKRPTDECNWHLHCLLVVPPSYFGRNYWNHETWVENWQESAKLSYRPVVEVHQVKSRMDKHQSLEDAILEVSKYTSKPQDLVSSSDWTIALTDQIKGVKSFSVGGVFREFIRQADLDRLEDTGRFGDESKQEGKLVCFTWNDDESIYDITRIGDKYYSFNN